MKHNRPNHPTAIVIFGGTGNLAETKLLPALFELFLLGMLPEHFTIIGLSRKLLSDSEYREYVHCSLRAKSAQHTEVDMTSFCSHLHYAAGDFCDHIAYERIKEHLLNFDSEIGTCTNKLLYLAVPPNLYKTIFENMRISELSALCDSVNSWARLLVEKPFGSDIETAAALEEQLQELFSEDQIYRIDHYLTKDSIENIISLRFANSILDDSWDGARIENIALRLFESQDVSTRGSFYDNIGALRDVGQNHILQMLALLTMKSVDIYDSHAMRAARRDVIVSLAQRDSDRSVHAQYKGYRETAGVNPDSVTETYFKIETHIENPEWKDVQFTLEAGKALSSSFAEAVITFRPSGTCMCAAEPALHTHRNVLHITFSPEQRICLTMWVKEPGFDFKLHAQELVLAQDTGEVFRSPEAYERVLYDCIIGDQTRFVSGEEIKAAWAFITPVLSSFATLPLHTYEKGSDVGNIS